MEDMKTTEISATDPAGIVHSMKSKVDYRFATFYSHDGSFFPKWHRTAAAAAKATDLYCPKAPGIVEVTR